MCWNKGGGGGGASPPLHKTSRLLARLGRLDDPSCSVAAVTQTPVTCQQPRRHLDLVTPPYRPAAELRLCFSETLMVTGFGCEPPAGFSLCGSGCNLSTSSAGTILHRHKERCLLMSPVFRRLLRSHAGARPQSGSVSGDPLFGFTSSGLSRNKIKLTAKLGANLAVIGRKSADGSRYEPPHVSSGGCSSFDELNYYLGVDHTNSPTTSEHVFNCAEGSRAQSGRRKTSRSLFSL